VTSPEARRDPVKDAQVRTMSDAGRVAKDRLESGLYVRRVGTADQAAADALLSCAASLMRLAGDIPRRDVPEQIVVSDDAQTALQVAGLIAELHVLRDTVRNLHGRLEALEDRP
jgi:hypothetical protein